MLAVFRKHRKKIQLEIIARIRDPSMIQEKHARYHTADWTIKKGLLYSLKRKAAFDKRSMREKRKECWTDRKAGTKLVKTI